MKYSLDLDGHELKAVHAALLEAKFHPHPFDADVGDSPYVANIVRRADDLLEASADHGGKPDRAAWRRLTPERPEWKAAQNHVERRSKWLRESRDKRRLHARHLLSPFVLDDEELDRFISESAERVGVALGED